MADVNNAELIQAKCNRLVPECLGRCTLYADLYSCCFLSPSRGLRETGAPWASSPVEGAHLGRRALAVHDSSSSTDRTDVGRGEPGREVEVLGGKVPVCGNLPPGPEAKQEACGL